MSSFMELPPMNKLPSAAAAPPSLGEEEEKRGMGGRREGGRTVSPFLSTT